MKNLVIVSAIVLAASVVFADDRAVPPIKKDCGSCHVSHKMATEVLLKSPLSELCAGCHPDRQAPNEHVVDIVPSMPVSNLPLSDSGKMTCITCHDPHGKGDFPKMLRARPSRICAYCHRM
ncbi:MAG: cytochrome c3 family protein [Thermodesulfovibrionales bacterium]|nr:cytochrome c3 family protein [Thermodesulfovibrionales bacterium]